MTICPCNPEKEFAHCCGPYLAGEKLPPTAEALMRSRYTAYTLDDYGYVIRTSHPSNRPSEKDFTDEVKIDWLGLDILDTAAGGEEDREGEVEFVARYQVSGRKMQQHERSQFIKEEGQWFYQDGDIVKPPQAHSEKVGRNEPCPCGSGKKYKKCCYK
ncbi:MAG: hypothetical protein HGA96_14555 [Desulfobulbaceae bacterium]|nr:hypothetical protein [Desulfobulbaceae bacterium]